MTSSIKQGVPEQFTPEFWAAASTLIAGETGKSYFELSVEEAAVIVKIKGLKKEIERITKFLDGKTFSYPCPADPRVFIVYVETQERIELRKEKKELYNYLTLELQPKIKAIWQKIWTTLDKIDIDQNKLFMPLVIKLTQQLWQETSSSPTKQKEESKTSG